jgi:hypothetical protein
MVIGICVLAVACVTQDTTSSFDIPYFYEDLPQSQSLVLQYINKYQKAVCLTPSDWPNSAGRLDQDPSNVWIEIEGKRFGIRPFNTGYCPKCARKVKPGDHITGKISYNDFDVPTHLYGAKKSLHFQPKGFHCK